MCIQYLHVVFPDVITPPSLKHLVNKVLGLEVVMAPISQVIAVLQSLERIGARKEELNKLITSNWCRNYDAKSAHAKGQFGYGASA